MTLKENIALTPEQRVDATKAAKFGQWYDEWRPYCLRCESTRRMLDVDYGYFCVFCHNRCGWDLQPIDEDLAKPKN